MPNFVPSPRETTPGSPPQVGQSSIYQDDSGNLFPAIITFVGETSPNGKLVNVAVIRLEPPAKEGKNPQSLGNPCAFTLNGWIYNIELGRIAYCPCGPPWPDHCP